MQRKAFTMIELIFVIVIIGILAAVAIPKFAANRNDAEANILVSKAKRVLVESVNFYMANEYHRYKTAKVPEITYIPLYRDIKCTKRSKMTDSLGLVGSTLYLCTNGHVPILKITSDNDGKFLNFKEIKTSTNPISGILSNNDTFQNLTNGTVGKFYYIYEF